MMFDMAKPHPWKGVAVPCRTYTHVKLRHASVSVNTENVPWFMMYILRKGVCLDFCNGSVYGN